MKLTKYVAPATLIFSLALILTAPVYSANPGRGNAESAPGQIKKQAVNVGRVDKVSGNTVVLDNKTNAVVDSTTKLVGQDRKIVRISQLASGDLVAVISTATASGSGKADKIFVKNATSSAGMKRQAIMGIITSINGSVMTLAHQIQRDRTWTIILSPQTKIKSKSVVSSQLSLLQVGMRVVVLGDASPSGLLAKWIHIIPGNAFGITKNQPPIATPSATPTGTPSATPTASPSATPTGTPSATPTI